MKVVKINKHVFFFKASRYYIPNKINKSLRTIAPNITIRSHASKNSILLKAWQLLKYLVKTFWNTKKKQKSFPFKFKLWNMVKRPLVNGCQVQLWSSEPAK